MVWQYQCIKNFKVLIVLDDIFYPELLSSKLYQLRKRQNHYEHARFCRCEFFRL